MTYDVESGLVGQSPGRLVRETVTVPLKDYMAQTDALLHLASRRHGFVETCDRCLNLRAVLKRLVGLDSDPSLADPTTHSDHTEEV